jgi:transcriptional regulator with XRE-family HTH domain
MISKKIADKLQDPGYRTAFVASQINVGIPFQIKALMKGRGWTQEQLAERTGMLQPRISAMLRPGKVRPNIETLRRYAEAFDCGLLVRFATYSELARWSEEFDPDTFQVPSFAEETQTEERKQELEKSAAAMTAHSTSLKGLAHGLPPDEFERIQSEAAKAIEVYALRNSTGLTTLKDLYGAGTTSEPGAVDNSPSQPPSPNPIADRSKRLYVMPPPSGAASPRMVQQSLGLPDVKSRKRA